MMPVKNSSRISKNNGLTNKLKRKDNVRSKNDSKMKCMPSRLKN